MFTPAVAHYLTQFYALGNTPAVDLTRGLPHGVNGDILLLGCGDVRNILFTAYSQKSLPPRQLDFTCCDISPAILARNTFLFSLLVENGQKHETSVLWSIYYGLFLDEHVAHIVQEHTARLLEASRSPAIWKESSYGQFLLFCDEGTLQLVREGWTLMSSQTTNSTSKAVFDKNLQKSRDYKQLRFRDSVVMTGFRSTSPAALLALESGQSPAAYEQYWKRDGSIASGSGVPNPMFSGLVSEDNILHYGTEPTLGFHLATTFVKLAPSSPLRPEKVSSDATLGVVRAAKTQFGEWLAAFRVVLKNGLRIRSVVSDAVTFCHVLATHSGAQTSTNTYRRQFDTSLIALDSDEYGPVGTAPRHFDVIDTSNLADHVGALNLLVATKRLLKDTPSSSVFIETLLKTTSTRQEQFDTLFCGNGVTVSLLLGLSPVEYWTNATSVSSVDELLINTSMPREGETQAHTRLAWKLSHHLSAAPASSKLRFEAEHLASFIYKMYVRMFDHERAMDLDLLNLVATGSVDFLKSTTAYPHYHRGSLASFLALCRNTVETDWSQFYPILLSTISQQSTVSNHSLNDFCLQLHLNDLHSTSIFSRKVCAKSSERISGDTSPESTFVAMTIVVPRTSLGRLHATDRLKAIAPTLQITLSSSDDATPKQTYLGLHLSFGHVTSHGTVGSPDFYIAMEDDRLGWRGDSPLIVSCFVPASVLETDSGNLRVTIGVQPTPYALFSFTQAGLGLSFEIFETTLADSSRVFLTQHMPNTTGSPVVLLNSDHDGPTESESSLAWFSVNLADDSKRVVSIVGHISVVTEPGKRLLADKGIIQLQQSSPFVIEVVLGNNEVVLPLRFPVPVLKEGSQTRVARKSLYVEVIAPIADPLDAAPLADFIYPAVLGPGSVPVVLNGHSMSLDTLPIVNVDTRQKKDLAFLTTLLSHTFSVRERLLRESGRSDLGFTANQRLNFKESIFSMFMVSSGLQGGQSGLFMLRHQELGGVLNIFVRSICLDGAAGSVVLDAAILPLTFKMVTSGELEEFLLVLRELQICAINVDDDELRLWRRLIPAFVERCRTWSHKKRCEYKRPGATIPLSQTTGEQFLCSCGNGKLPENYVNIPEWDVASNYAVRAAISPTFSVPFVEDIMDTSKLMAAGSGGLSAGIQDLSLTDKCRKCGKKHGAGGQELKACSRCKEVMYCSRDCQKADWKKHRHECST